MTHTSFPLSPRQWAEHANYHTKKEPTVDLDTQYLQALNANNQEAAEHLEHALDEQEQERERRLNSPTALRDAALWYANAGLPVFPVRPGEKRPLTAHGFKDATTDTDQITEWWTKYAAANIGLPTGGLFDVIDVDGQPGYESYGLMRERGMVPDIIGRANTPRGIHVYIQATGDGNTTSILPGIDYRGAGGYVLAPPSRLTNGNVYRWQQPLTLTGDH